jgi:hypothetical protein
VVTKPEQTRPLGESEIKRRCIATAVQRLARREGTAGAKPYFEVLIRIGIAPALTAPLIDFVVRRSISWCNDEGIYELLMNVLEQGGYVSEAYLAPIKAVIARCLKDETFQTDFREELHSGNKNLAAGACVILTEQKLVTSCP